VVSGAEGDDVVQIGNVGVWIGDGATGATLTDVTVRGMSGVCVHIGCASLPPSFLTCACVAWHLGPYTHISAVR
jgi:hypothetical protein